MTRRILLADDDADDRLLFEEVFTDLPESDYKLFTAENGDGVIALLEDEVNDDELPHLIILDQNMPLRSGKETLIYLKGASRYKHIPVIIYSTYNDKNFIAECEALGVNAVVSKPDSYEGYVSMINTFLKYTDPPIEKGSPESKRTFLKKN
jgi:CheY-like chemotaxis protein